MAIISEHFMPAGKKAGVPAPWAFHFQTGDWDAANALWAKYYSMVADSKTEVGHWHVPKDNK